MPYLEQTLLAKSISSAIPCLYNFNNHACSYNPISPPIYFSLGDAIAALGLIIAVVQLSKPTWGLSLEIRGKWYSSIIWILSSLGLISVLIASLIPNFPLLSLPRPLSYPLFWEQLGFVFFALAPFLYFYIANKHNDLFNEKRAENFYDILLKKITLGKSEELKIPIDITLANLNKLTDAVKVIDTLYPSGKDEINPEHDYAIYAYNYLDLLLSEREVADYIVSKRIDFLFALLTQLKKKQISRYALSRGLDELFQRLFLNDNSYLYKQINNQGISLYASVYKLIFCDNYFTEELGVLSKWQPYLIPEVIVKNRDFIKVYLEALEKAIKTCGFNSSRGCHNISIALDKLIDYSRVLSWKSEKSDKWSREIEYFFGHTFPRLYKEAYEANNVSEFEKLASKNRKYNQSLTARYAEALTELIGELSRIDEFNLERDRALVLTFEILSIHDHSPIFNNIRKCFLQHLWENIKDNVKYGHFPAVLRIYIELMVWNGNGLPKWHTVERARLLKYLNKHLGPRILKGELMANYKTKKENELLPAFITFDHTKKKFMYIHKDGKKKQFK